MKFIIFIIAMAVARIGSADSTTALPPLKTAKQIDLIAKFDWLLRINTDGSAMLQFGSIPTDFAKCPVGTFVFPDIYNLLIPKLQEKGDPDDVAVAIRTAHKTSVTTRYVSLSEVKEIFVKAEQQSIALDEARFERLLKEYPVKVPKREGKRPRQDGQSIFFDQLDKKLK